MALDRSSWLPSPRQQSFRYQGVDMSVLDGSIMAKHQVLETQEPEFISKLETSLLQVLPQLPWSCPYALNMYPRFRVAN